MPPSTLLRTEIGNDPAYCRCADPRALFTIDQHPPRNDQPAHGDEWDWVLAAPFRAHVRRVLTEEPLPWRAFAGHALVPDNVVRRLLGLQVPPARRIPPHYARALFGIDGEGLRKSLARVVAPDELAQAARTLHDAGWLLGDIARAGDLPEQHLAALLQGADWWVTHRNTLLLTAAVRAHGLEPDLDEPLDPTSAAA